MASIPDSDSSFIAAALLSSSLVLSAVLVILSVSCLTLSTLLSISVAWLAAPEATSEIALATSPDTFAESDDMDDMVSTDARTCTATSVFCPTSSLRFLIISLKLATSLPSSSLLFIFRETVRSPCSALDMTSEMSLIALVILNENMKPNITASILNPIPAITVVVMISAALALTAFSGTAVTTVMPFAADL